MDTVDGTTTPGHDPYAALRLPAFRRFLAGSLLLQIGKSAQGLAIGWEIYQRTGQPFSLGVTGLVQAIPMFLFTLPAGYLADILDRRKLLVASLIGTTATSLILAFISHRGGSVGLIYMVLFLDSTLARLSTPARTAMLPLLVPREAFENSVKWRTSLSQISGMMGPTLAGVLIAWSLPSAYLLAAGCSLIFIVFLAGLRLRAAPQSQPGRMLSQVAEGVLFVWRQKVLLGAISLDLFAVLFGGATYLLPMYAKDILEASSLGLTPEESLGWLRAAPAAGALVMAFFLAHRPPLRRAGRTLMWAVAGFGVATIAFGFSRTFWLSWAMLFMTGFCDNISVVVRHTLVQLETPNEMRGRVSAVNAIFIGSSNELGGFESGLVAQWLGPTVSVVSGGATTLFVVAAWSWLFPGLRRFGRLTDTGGDGADAGTSSSRAFPH